MHKFVLIDEACCELGHDHLKQMGPQRKSLGNSELERCVIGQPLEEVCDWSASSLKGVSE